MTSRQLLILFLLSLFHAAAFSQEKQFLTAGDENAKWSAAANWSPAGAPGAQSVAVLGPENSYIVQLDENGSVGWLKIGNDDDVIHANGKSLTVNQGIENNNLYKMESRSDRGNVYTDLVFANGAMLTGDGILRMSVFSNNRILGNQIGALLTNGADHWIAGSGKIGANSLVLVNDGVLKADQSMPLTIDPVDHLDYGVVNNNEFVATNGGELQLGKGNFDNRRGRIVAREDSKVTLLSGASIFGGILEAEKNGRFVIPDGQSPRLDSVSNNALVFQGSRQDAGSVFTDVVLDSSSVLLSGSGLWRMSNYKNNRIYGFSPTWRLENGEQHTIAGSGNIGADFMTFINHGVVKSDQSSPLVIDPADQAVGFGCVNRGEFIASKSGRLKLYAGRYDNTGGMITVKDKAIVELLTGVAVFGGSFESLDGGKFLIPEGSRPFLDSVENNAAVVHDSRDLSPEMYTDVVLYSQKVELTGDGTWEMSNSPNNRILGGQADYQLVNGTDHTIQGAGQIGADFMGLVNQGKIVANQTIPLVLDPFDNAQTCVVNNGILMAIDGGDLQLASGRYLNDEGKIVAGNSSTVTFLSGADIAGGIFECDGSGQFLIPGGHVPKFGSLTNNGSIRQDGRTDVVEEYTDVLVASQAVINGSGIWRLSNSPNNRIVSVSSTKTSNLLNGPDHTIAGSGQLGVNTLELNNQGGIRADQSSPLKIDPAGGESVTRNFGLFVAANGGELQLADGVYDNSSGQILVEADSKVSLFSGVTIFGGRIECSGDGYVSIPSKSRICLGSIANNGLVVQEAEQLEDSFADVIIEQELVTIDGNGTWRLGESINNRIYGFSPNWVLVNGKDHTIAGSGQIGLNSLQLKNEGAIVADQVEPLQIDPGNSSLEESEFGFINSGRLVSVGDGEMKLGAANYLNDATGVVVVNSLTSLSAGANLVNDGQLLGEGELVIDAGSSFINRSTISPGDPVGRLYVRGDLKLEPASVLKIEINSSSQFDQLKVDGCVAIDGAIQIELKSGYMPGQGEQFVVVEAERATNKFSSNLVQGIKSEIVDHKILFEGGECTVRYDGQRIVLQEFVETGTVR